MELLFGGRSGAVCVVIDVLGAGPVPVPALRIFSAASLVVVSGSSRAIIAACNRRIFTVDEITLMRCQMLRLVTQDERRDFHLMNKEIS